MITLPKFHLGLPNVWYSCSLIISESQYFYFSYHLPSFLHLHKPLYLYLKNFQTPLTMVEIVGCIGIGVVATEVQNAEPSTINP